MRYQLIRALGACVLLLVATSCTTGEAGDATSTAALPSVTASPSRSPSPDVVVPDLTEESCQDILTAVGGARDALNTAVDDITAAPEAFSQVAENLRAAAANAGAELSASADELAAAFDDLAAQIRSGDLLNLNLASLQEPLQRLFTLCDG